MIHLALQTEFSFKKCFLHMSDIHKYVIDGYVGIADLNNTYGHIPLLKESRKHGFKPIFGVRLHVLPDDSDQRVCNTSWIFIAKNDKGLQELYGLVSKAYDQFYYIPKLNESDIMEISDNIFIISSHKSKIVDVDYQALGQGQSAPRYEKQVAIVTNNFPLEKDRDVYELLCGARKNGDGYSYFYSDCTYPQHILSEEEFDIEYGNTAAQGRTHMIAKSCDANILEAEMVTWKGSHDLIASMNMNKVKNWTPEYDSRLAYEIGLIREKGSLITFL